MIENYATMKFASSGKYEITVIGEELLLIPANTQDVDTKVLVLNEISSNIWNLLILEEYTFNDCLNYLLNEYDVKKDTLIKDINEFISKLIFHKAIVKK